MDIRFRFGVIGFLAMIAALVWLFPTWYPIIDRDSVPNPFPGLEETAWEAFLKLSPDEQAAYRALRDGNRKEEIDPQPAAALALVRARLLTAPILAPESEATYTPPENTPTLRTGTFRAVDLIRWARGRIAIYQLENQQRVLRFESVSDEANAPTFETIQAPDVHVIFTRNPDPLDKAGIGVDFIDLGALKATKGNQTYVISDNDDLRDLNEYPVLALYSPSLNLVISTATLR
jgi:hypothetical protein